MLIVLGKAQEQSILHVQEELHPTPMRGVMVHLPIEIELDFQQVLIPLP